MLPFDREPFIKALEQPQLLLTGESVDTNSAIRFHLALFEIIVRKVICKDVFESNIVVKVLLYLPKVKPAISECLNMSIYHE